MNTQPLLAVLLATVWISISEFIRNELLFNYFWIDHYDSLGLTFPAEPINGAMWGVWSLLLALAIFILSRKFSLGPTALLSWFMAFVMMWVVVGNLHVLPYGLLLYAIPLSLLECIGAAWIIFRLVPPTDNAEKTA